MTRSYLPLNSLRAFEAAARHLSFTHAAIELNVTHSAISQHVKALEQHLNCQLFVRVSRGLMLTTEGENLLPVLNDSFDRIAGMLDRFANHRAQEKLKIGVVGTFAIGVLFSQLDDFRRGYPHIDLQLSTPITTALIRLPKGLTIRSATVAGRGMAPRLNFFVMRRSRRCVRPISPPVCTVRPTSSGLRCCAPTDATSGPRGCRRPASTPLRQRTV